MAQDLVLTSDFGPTGHQGLRAVHPGWLHSGFCLLLQKGFPPLQSKYSGGIIELEDTLGSSDPVDFKAVFLAAQAPR